MYRRKRSLRLRRDLSPRFFFYAFVNVFMSSFSFHCSLLRSFLVFLMCMCVCVWLGKIFNMYSLIFLFRQWLSICRTRGAILFLEWVGGASWNFKTNPRTSWLPKRAAAPASIRVVVCVRARDLSCVLSLSVIVSGVSVSVSVGEHVSVCLCVYVLLFAKKLTFKTQKSAQVACICVLFSRLACLCLFVFVSSQTRHDRFCVFSIFVLFLICPSMLQSV